MSDLQCVQLATLARFTAGKELRGGRRSWGPKRYAQGRNWEWEKLVGEHGAVLNTPRCMLLDATGLAEDLLVQSRNVILHCWFTYWNASATHNTTRCAVRFRRRLGVSTVSSSFVRYKLAFLLARSVRWDVDVAWYDLSLEEP